MAYKKVEEKLWQTEFKGWEITDCSIRPNQMICLCLQKRQEYIDDSDEELSRTKFIIFSLKDPAARQSISRFNNTKSPKTGIALFPQVCGLIVFNDVYGTVASVGPNIAGAHKIDEKGWPLPHKIKCIDGYAYSAGGLRRVYKRMEANQWELLHNGIHEPGQGDRSKFNDIDGFNESDIYAVGADNNKGEVWHYNGTVWMQQQFPDEGMLMTVTCADNGLVYVTSHKGSIWAGRADKWERIYTAAYNVPWNDTVWFQGQLWLSSDYMFRIWNGSDLVLVADDERESAALATGHMDARDGILVIAGLFEVWVFDGKEWIQIVQPYTDK